jgi:hypothetical protein
VIHFFPPPFFVFPPYPSEKVSPTETHAATHQYGILFFFLGGLDRMKINNPHLVQNIMGKQVLKEMMKILHLDQIPMGNSGSTGVGKWGPS